MHKQLTATGLITLCLVIGAGTLLTAQLQMAGGEEWTGVPVWSLWLGEALVYLAAILLWAPGISLLHLAGGILTLVLFRLFIGTGAALVNSFVHAQTGFSKNLSSTLLDIFPVSCSVVFALLALYPLRSVFSRAARNTRLKQQASRQAAAKIQNAPDSSTRAGTFLFGAPDATSAKYKESRSVSQKDSSKPPIQELPEHLKGCKIPVPLRVIFPQMPAGVLRASLAEKVLEEKMEVQIPLSVAISQLKEALIVITVGDLLAYLPKAWIEQSSLGTDEEITLPLEIVVPQLPEEVLQLPKVSPPSWMTELEEEEKILFAQV